MNNKGFTLVEMLAVVVILAVIMGIATNGVIGYINTSKEKSEKIFVNKLATSIESYLSLKGGSLSKVESGVRGNFIKNNGRGTEKDVGFYEIRSFSLIEIVSENLVDQDSLINPKNKQKCFNNGYPSVRVFKDSDFVYYYYVDLSSNSCSIERNNWIVNNIPSSLCDTLKSQDENIKCGNNEEESESNE